MAGRGAAPARSRPRRTPLRAALGACIVKQRAVVELRGATTPSAHSWRSTALGRDPTDSPSFIIASPGGGHESEGRRASEPGYGADADYADGAAQRSAAYETLAPSLHQRADPGHREPESPGGAGPRVRSEATGYSKTDTINRAPRSARSCNRSWSATAGCCTSSGRRRRAGADRIAQAGAQRWVAPRPGRARRDFTESPYSDAQAWAVRSTLWGSRDRARVRPVLRYRVPSPGHALDRPAIASALAAFLPPAASTSREE